MLELLSVQWAFRLPNDAFSWLSLCVRGSRRDAQIARPPAHPLSVPLSQGQLACQRITPTRNVRTTPTRTVRTTPTRTVRTTPTRSVSEALHQSDRFATIFSDINLVRSV